MLRFWKFWLLCVIVGVFTQYGPSSMSFRIIVWAVAAGVAGTLLEAGLRFEPFVLHIRLNRAALIDGRIATDEQLGKIEQRDELDWPLTEGIRISVLRLRNSIQSELIFWNKEGRFTTDIDTSFDLDKLAKLTDAKPTEPLRGLGYFRSIPPRISLQSC